MTQSFNNNSLQPARESFNNNILQLAREFRGISQADLACRAGLTQGHYSKIEHGLILKPAPKHVECLSQILEFLPSFFYQRDERAELSMISAVKFRGRQTPSGERKRMLASMNIHSFHLRRLILASNINPQFLLPKIDVEEGSGPRKIAHTLRATWAIPDGPITDLTDYCERAGIVIIHCDLAKTIDGMTSQTLDLPACIFLNKKVTADRMRFSLAHELGHIIMHDIPGDDMENEANAFAIELLVPEEEFRQMCIGQEITLPWLARQKMYWKVSMAALLRRAEQINVITRHHYIRLQKEISWRGWRKREPQETDLPFEKLTVFPRLIQINEELCDYDMGRLAQMLHMPAEGIHRMYVHYLSRKNQLCVIQ